MGGRGGGRGTKKISAQGKIKWRNSCTPINLKKYSCYGLKKIHTRNLITKTIPATRKSLPPPTYNFSNGSSLRRLAYRVCQKFVPPNTCDITFDRNYTSAWNFVKSFIALLSTYIRKVYIRHALLCLLSRSEAVAAWSGISHVAWRAGFSSSLVWAVFPDPSWF